ncbi:MAG: protein phosphatase CheZ [Rhodospirillaceae bacterium]
MRPSSGYRPFTAERQLRKAQGEAAGSGSSSGAGNGEVLAEIADLKETLAMLTAQVEALTTGGTVAAPVVEEGPTDEEQEELDRKATEVRMLKIELNALAHSIETTKKEIALLIHQNDQGDRLTTVASELDAVVAATEDATDSILGAVEKIGGLTEQIQAHEPDGFVRQLADEIQENTLAIFESCNFQDLTGQRITKVVNTLKYVEERVDRMMEIWGRDTFQDLPTLEEAVTATADEENRLLNGPQDQEKGISQDEIDRLFD